MRHVIDSRLMRLARQRKRQQQANQLPPRLSAWRRFQSACFAGMLGLFVGGLFDLIISVMRTLSQPHDTAGFIWFLAYVFAGIGVVAGSCFGTRAGELFVQLFGSSHEEDSSASGELLKLMAKVLLGAALIWAGFLLFL